jgi:hypothetical protein
VLVLFPGAKAAGEEVVREVQRGESRQERESPKDEPQDAEHANFAGITREFKLKAGRRDNRRD